MEAPVGGSVSGSTLTASVTLLVDGREQQQHQQQSARMPVSARAPTMMPMRSPTVPLDDTDSALGDADGDADGSGLGATYVAAAKAAPRTGSAFKA